MNVTKLPKGYEAAKKIDICRNRRDGIAINALSLLLLLITLAVGVAVSGSAKIKQLILPDNNGEMGALLIKLASAIVFCALYILLREAVHALFMKLFCKECKIIFGCKIAYVYSGSNALFDKRSYIIISAAPLVLLGLAVALICAAVPEEWFWPVYFVQMLNVSGAAGDIYVFSIISRMPENILIKDAGDTMTVYSKV